MQGDHGEDQDQHGHLPAPPSWCPNGAGAKMGSCPCILLKPLCAHWEFSCVCKDHCSPKPAGGNDDGGCPLAAPEGTRATASAILSETIREPPRCHRQVSLGRESRSLPLHQRQGEGRCHGRGCKPQGSFPSTQQVSTRLARLQRSADISIAGAFNIPMFKSSLWQASSIRVEYPESHRSLPLRALSSREASSALVLFGIPLPIAITNLQSLHHPFLK